MLAFRSDIRFHNRQVMSCFDMLRNSPELQSIPAQQNSPRIPPKANRDDDLI
jgi:hypothetical protein